MIKNKGPIVLRGVIFDDQILRDRFETVYRIASYMRYDTYLVGVLYRIIRLWLSENGWAGVTLERLMMQFSMEFDIGFTNGAGLVEPPAAALSELEWLQVEVYLGNIVPRDRLTGVKVSHGMFPLWVRSLAFHVT